VIYQPPPPVVVHQAPPYYYYRPRPPKSVFAERNEWGINLRAEGAFKGSGSSSTEPMTGAGFGLRYKPVPAFGVEAAFDFLSGHDYNDNRRNETEFTVNAMVFVNPRSRVQLYFLAGLGASWAHVQNNSDYYPSNYNGFSGDTNYTYFGGQAGGGLEFRIARHFAMNIDARGFIRGRTDSAAAYNYEYTNPTTGQKTNTSDGALVTVGMTFYF
jgi:opacity protein-like surface antigen